MSQSDITGVHLQWPMHRAGRPFVVHVVEPDQYDPTSHTPIFNAVINYLLAPPRRELLGVGHSSTEEPPDPFDLVVFPEAFVSADAFVKALQVIARAGSTGCIHIGLRPTEDNTTHLFTVALISGLLSRISGLGVVESNDLQAFSSWLVQQGSKDRFNIGAVFAVDACGLVRVCLHPKQVRSQFETTPLPEQHMAEADLLSVITLIPHDKSLHSVTLQPIICSDLLDLPRDRNGVPPVHGLNLHADKIMPRAPDHVDVVSVVTYTPQPERLIDGKAHRRWHEKFLDGFRDTQRGSLPKHNSAAIVLANFRHLEARLPGGLSGAFLPIPSKSVQVHRDVVATYYGRTKEAFGNEWSKPGDDTTTWESLGVVSGLDPFSDPSDTPVRVFGFTIQRLPRDSAMWDHRKPGFTDCSVLNAVIDDKGRLGLTRG